MEQPAAEEEGPNGTTSAQEQERRDRFEKHMFAFQVQLYREYLTKVSLKEEKAMAEDLGLRWQERGPKAEGRPDRWRGQRYRPGTGKWANRGGQNRDFFKKKYGFGGWSCSSSSWSAAAVHKDKGK